LPSLHGLGLGHGGAIEHASAAQSLELRDAQAPVGGACGDDHHLSHDLGPVGERHYQAVLAASQTRRVAREVEGGPEQPRLRIRLRGKLLATDPAREAEVVADHGAASRLAAKRVLLQDKRAEALRSAIDCGGETRRPGTDDDEVEGPLLGADVHPEGYVLREGVDDLRVRGIDEHAPVEEHHHGEPRRGLAHSGEQFLSLTGVRVVELEMDPAARPQVSELVRARRPGPSHDADRHKPGAVDLRPLVQELGDHPVEPLVGGYRRLVQVVVDAPEGGRPEDGFPDRSVPTRDEECPLRGREEMADAGEELGSGHAGHPLVCEHDRHVLPGCLELAQPGHRGLCRALGHDAVVLTVTLAELAFDPAAGVGVSVDGEQHRSGRARSRRPVSARLRPRVDSLRAAPLLPVGRASRQVNQVSHLGSFCSLGGSASFRRGGIIYYEVKPKRRARPSGKRTVISGGLRRSDP